MDIVETSRGDGDVVEDHSPEVEIDGESSRLEHLAMLQVFDIDTMEVDIEGQETNGDTIDAHLCIQLLGETLHRKVLKTILHRFAADCYKCGHQ